MFARSYVYHGGITFAVLHGTNRIEGSTKIISTNRVFYRGLCFPDHMFIMGV